MYVIWVFEDVLGPEMDYSQSPSQLGKSFIDEDLVVVTH